MSVPLWTVELHSHTVYSADSLVKLDELQAICQARGIDRLAITDHDTAQAALEMARMYPTWIIPGEEIMTTQGEILAWYIKEEVPGGLTPQETIQRLRDQGAVIGIAHPLDRYRKGAWTREQLLAIVDQVEAIEVFNSRCIHNADNLKALEFAREHGKLMTCGSDAHAKREYGRAVMQTRPFANSADGLREALKDATRQEKLSGIDVHFSSKYALWIKRLIPSLKPTRNSARNSARE
jgi:predicted metal-dependent phosphoesterase TrpH